MYASTIIKMIYYNVILIFHFAIDKSGDNRAPLNAIVMNRKRVWKDAKVYYFASALLSK